MPAPLGPTHTPYDALGHDAAVALAKRFYDHMDAHEPELVAATRASGCVMARSP